ncbi:MAG: toll/interleukin-1 receptor domain-containing protein, partial [Deltaproteobacteria bacterium]|nr:toll/interleukin-1 receptor domain-containing protein [Deltaproteobacteria bacterium]
MRGLDPELRKCLVDALTLKPKSARHTWSEIIRRYGHADRSDALDDEASWDEVMAHERVIAYLPIIVAEAGIELELRHQLLNGLRAQAVSAIGDRSDATRHFVSYAVADGEEIKEEIVRALKRSHSDVFVDESIPTGKVWRRELAHQLLLADVVNLAWTDAASCSRWVRWEVDYATALNRLATEDGGYDDAARPKIKPEGDGPKDDALVRELNILSHQTRAGLVHWQLTVAWVASMILLAWLPEHAAVPNGWLGLLVLSGAMLVMLHYFGRRPFKRQFARAARWLETARAHEVFTLSEWVITRLYGPRLWSARGIGVSVCMSTIFSLPVLAVTIGFADLWRANESYPGQFETHLFQMILMTLALDFLSLVVTKKIVRWLATRSISTVTGTLLGLALDISVAGLFVLVPIHIFGMVNGLDVLTGRWASTFEIVGSTVWSIAIGRIAVQNMFGGPFPAMFVAGLLWTASAVAPSLIHGVLLLTGVVLRVGRRLQHLMTKGMAHAAGDPRGPLGIAYLGLVLGTGLWLGSNHSTLDRSTTVPRWAHFSLSSGDTCVMTHEVTQEWWFDIATSQYGRDMQLPPFPSTFVGSRLPAETVSWCESLRFLNAWSAIDGRIPVYCEPLNDNTGCESYRRSWSPRHELQGCEAGVEILQDGNSSGYRLPSPRQWRAVLGVARPRGAWHTANSGFRTHAFIESTEVTGLLGNVS